MKRLPNRLLIFLSPVLFSGGSAAAAESPAEQAGTLLEAARFTGGLIVHAGCGDGRLTTALAGDGRLVFGLTADTAALRRTREHARSRGLCGRVALARWDGKRLPCIDNLADLVVAGPGAGVGRDEITRVLAPGGTAVFPGKDGAAPFTKPRPDAVDAWTHYLHGPDNNAVARDTVVGPPRRLQWAAGPRWTRHHDWLNSVSAMVTAGGRLFSILDEASPANLNLPGKWALVARGAFNGVLLWKRPLASWIHHRQRFRSGPPQAARLLVASGKRIYVPLALGGPVVALDAATGETVRTFAQTAGAEEIVLAGGTLLVLRGRPAAEQAFTHPSVRKKHEFPNTKTLVAVDAASGKTAWTWEPQDAPLPQTLAADGQRVYIRLAAAVVCLDKDSGRPRWRHACGKPSQRKKITFGKHTLVVADGVVLTNLPEKLLALAAADGKKLWACAAGSSFHAPLDIFAIDGLVWHKVGHKMDPMRVPPDRREARDLHTGELKVRDAVPANLVSVGHHFRCYRAKATSRYIIMNKRGAEMVDLAGDDHSRNNWVRGTCQYGIMPANGLLYTPPNSCGCYMEALLRGFNALAGARKTRPAADGDRLAKGPAYGKLPDAAPSGADAWPTLRHDPRRSGVAGAAVPATLKRSWATAIGGRPTQPVAAGGRVLVADADAGIVCCLDAADGTVRWRRVAGARVDSPPTIYRGTVLFGSADGLVTCLRLEDGATAWRFRAAPVDTRCVAFDRVASPWPVHGSVLLQGGTAYVCAGRSTWLDGGMYLYGLDPATGAIRCKNHVASRHPVYRAQDDVESTHIKGHLWTDYKTFTQPDRSDTYSIAGGITDVPVGDGTGVFIRHLMFDAGLREKTGRSLQLFSTSSLLDGAEHHRSDWGLGTGDHGRMPAARHKGGFSRFHIEDSKRKPPYRTDRPTALMMVFADGAVWGARRKHRRRTFGDYELFKTVLDGGNKQRSWRVDLPVRPRALLKAGGHLVLATMPKNMPDDDPHAAYAGRLGGALRIRRERDGAEIAAVALDAPVVWDGMAAAGGHLYLSTVDGRVTCFTGGE